MREVINQPIRLHQLYYQKVARLLNHDFEDLVKDYTIVDCRYPYEYEGGHIQVGMVSGGHGLVVVGGVKWFH